MRFDYGGFTILHGEDDEADARIMEIVLQKIEYNGKYIREKHGHKLLDRIKGNGVADHCLLLIDIGLPGVNGKEILEYVRKTEKTKGMPVVIMTGSSSVKDYNDCIMHGANGYIKKTANHQELIQVCQRFFEGWCIQSRQEFF
jgi:DNA-binding response OmpR family regulator